MMRPDGFDLPGQGGVFEKGIALHLRLELGTSPEVIIHAAPVPIGTGELLGANAEFFQDVGGGHYGVGPRRHVEHPFVYQPGSRVA